MWFANLSLADASQRVVGRGSMTAFSEKFSVQLSFYGGGLGLLALKALAFFISGSSLVRASMFESLGDVISSVIMMATQRRVADTSDSDLYPTGKHRLAGLGILFFCAFMVATMGNNGIDAMSELFAPEEEEGPTSGELIRQLFEDRPKLRRALPRGETVEDLVARYEISEDGADSQQGIVLFLLFLGLCTKAVCWVVCGSAARAGSDIARTLLLDHRNDIISNAAVITITALLTVVRRQGYHGRWLNKVDPLSSLLLSIWILWGWVDQALEQVQMLSNRRAEQEQREAVTAAARGHLQGGQLGLVGADVYHCGDGFAATLEVASTSDSAQHAGLEDVSVALENLERAVKAADCGVREVHAKLKSKAGASSTPAGSSWVNHYQTPGAS